MAILSAIAVAAVWPQTAAAAKLEVLAGAKSVTVELSPCAPAKGDVAPVAGVPSGRCPASGGKPRSSLLGAATIIVRNSTASDETLSAKFIPAGSPDAISLPGDATWISLEDGSSRPAGFVDALLGRLTAQIGGRLADKVGKALPLLTPVAIGRLAAANQLASSPALVKEVTAVLRRGVGGISDRAIAGLGRKLDGLIVPRGRTLRMSVSQGRSLLFSLESTLAPPGGVVAGEALAGALPEAFALGQGSALVLQKEEVRPLSIRFALPAGQSPGAVAGNLVLSVNEEAQTIALTGAMRQLKEVSVEPASLKMDSDRDRASVTLTGADLVEFLRSAPVGPSGTVRDDSGHAATVEVQMPTAAEVAASDDPNRAQATVELTGGDPSPGKYTGSVRLSSLSVEGPAVAVELHAHRSFLWLVALAFLGVLIGGLLTRLVTLAMRRSLLLKILGQSMATYRHVLASGPTRSWHLEDLLDEPPTAAQDDRLQGVPALTTSIETARSGKDLDEDTSRVLDTIARIQRWLRLEPAARRLALVAESASPPDLSPADGTPQRWEDSKTSRDTRILLEAANREPVDVAAADVLVERLLSQARWHHRVAEAWSAVAAAGSADLAKAFLAIDALLGDDASVETRKPEDQDVLDSKLLAFAKKSLAIELTEPPAPADPSGTAGVTPARWSASPNLFTGWATLDSQSYGQLSRRAVTSARALAWPDLTMEAKSLRLPDFTWSMVSLILACLVYALASYGDTWGTDKDLANAFLAGVLGTVAVKWAALPIFQSIRVRSSKTT
jgi:hypothetical protein